MGKNLPKEGETKLLHIRANRNSTEQWQAANPTISGLLSHLLGLLTVGKYKQIASSATNSQ